MRCHGEVFEKPLERAKGGQGPKAIHAGLECSDCHTQPANYRETPHFATYRKVSCGKCHAEATRTFALNAHGVAGGRGNAKAPGCTTCHGTPNDAHDVKPVTKASAEALCRKCHSKETERYDASIHAGKPGAPGCVTCHTTHSEALPPSAGAVNKSCQGCHEKAMKGLEGGAHADAQAKLGGTMSCASCHDVHGTHKPKRDEKTLQACESCHAGYREQFKGSVHEALLGEGMTCLSCHRTHQVQDAKESESYNCGTCHSGAEEEYRKSSHRLARLKGKAAAATCASCHGGHGVLPASDPKSPVHRNQVPATCGACHSGESVITSDYVRLPISLTRYTESIHGKSWKDGKPAAVCSDCHGAHDLQGGAAMGSTISKPNLAGTCGKCHEKAAKEYANSVHGRAVEHGLHDAPSCTDCHEEHMIVSSKDPRSPVRRENMVTATCARCHENKELNAKYGLQTGVVASYKDSYHGWAFERGGNSAAICVDCHNTHEIRSQLDPDSSTHPANVTDTCGRCHEGANAKFAASYSHIEDTDRRLPHDWVRIVYFWLILLTLGGMGAHNVLIFAKEVKQHYRHQMKEKAVRRMSLSDILQHAVLAFSFIGLAVSGFALRAPDSWWAQGLTAIGFSEEVRRLFHRLMAALLVLSAVLHVADAAFTSTGRAFVKNMLPGPRDALDAIHNVLYYLGLRKEHPKFDVFDYTQKAEYWALIWGTIAMSVTGFVLWFPTLATTWFPPWIVRVAEAVHYYEAILAVGAIVIWHFFFTIIRPSVYPMSWIWITGRMPMEEWKKHHGRAAERLGDEVEIDDPEAEEAEGAASPAAEASPAQAASPVPVAQSTGGSGTDSGENKAG